MLIDSGECSDGHVAHFKSGRGSQSERDGEGGVVEEGE